MKTLTIIITALLIIPSLLKSQSILDIAPGTELNIGAGADVCADAQTGVGIISGSGTFCGGVLPVELASFVAVVNNRYVTLKWVTSSEENNSGFRIERKESGEVWAEAGFISGQGNSNVSVEYNFTDKNLSSGKYSYRLRQEDYNGNYEYYELGNEVSIGVPQIFELSQNYPNPFNPSTKINYGIPFDGKVQLHIFDITGKQVAELMNKFQTAGSYNVDFNAASELTSGTYFYKITVEGNTQTFSAVKKMSLIK